MEKAAFGFNMDGQEVSIYTIKNSSGAKIVVTDLGASLVSVIVPDQTGKMTDVVLGYDHAAPYETNGNFFGATIGRCCNRTAGAVYQIGDRTYTMEANEKENNLHSGSSCYGRKVWQVKTFATDYITFSLFSPDGEGGFPGNLQIDVTYTFTEDNQVKIHYDGICDQDTIVNMTNHSYFNLSGHDQGSVLSQYLMIDAESYTPVRTGSITTGEILSVKNTPMDFQREKQIGRDIDEDYEQLKLTGGYDHNYVLNKQNCGIRPAAKARCLETGIEMTMYTDAVGVQFYAGNFIGGPEGKNGAVYPVRSGFCLETQFYPNAANIAHFPSPVLKKGEKYEATTIYKFSLVER